MRICSVCDLKEYNELDPLGHTYGAWISEDLATCEDESALGHYTCSDCEKSFDANKNVISSILIPATGLDKGEWDTVGLTGEEDPEFLVRSTFGARLIQSRNRRLTSDRRIKIRRARKRR